MRPAADCSHHPRRHRPGSDIDLTLVASNLSHHDRLRLMGALDDLLLP